MCILDRVIPLGAYFVSRLAEGMAVFIEGNIIRGVFGSFCPAIDVDESIDVPVFEQLVSGDVVMCGIKTDIFGERPKQLRPKSSMASRRYSGMGRKRCRRRDACSKGRHVRPVQCHCRRG